MSQNMSSNCVLVNLFSIVLLFNIYMFLLLFFFFLLYLRNKKI